MSFQPAGVATPVPSASKPGFATVPAPVAFAGCAPTESSATAPMSMNSLTFVISPLLPMSGSTLDRPACKTRDEIALRQQEHEHQRHRPEDGRCCELAPVLREA